MRYIIDCNGRMSKIGLGTVRFGTVIPEPTSFEILDCFFENGGNIIDTARGYFQEIKNGRGRSELTIGKWIKLNKNRKDIFLVTKGGLIANERNWSFNLDYNNLIKEAVESLEALQTDYIDCYLLHCDEPERPVEEIVETMQEVRRITKAKKIGVSNWSLERLIQANKYAQSKKIMEFTVIQTYWSVAGYTDTIYDSNFNTYMNAEMYNFAQMNNYMVMAYASQAKGFFQKAIEKGIENIPQLLKERFSTLENIKKIDVIKDFCDKNNVSPTAVVTSYITSQPINAVALVGPSTISQIKDIITVSDYILPDNMMNDLN